MSDDDDEADDTTEEVLETAPHSAFPFAPEIDVDEDGQVLTYILDADGNVIAESFAMYGDDEDAPSETIGNALVMAAGPEMAKVLTAWMELAANRNTTQDDVLKMMQHTTNVLNRAMGITGEHILVHNPHNVPSDKWYERDANDNIGADPDNFTGLDDDEVDADE